MKKLTYFLLTFLLVPIATFAQNESDAVKAKIERIENGLMPVFQVAGREVPTFNINERLKQMGIPGLSIAVVNNGKIEWARAYGMADIGENQPMTTETMLLAGSISKPIAALRAHQLVESGTFVLDNNVNDYLKSWTLPDNEFTAKEKVTLRRILNHTAGLTVWGFPGYDKGDKVPTTAEVLDGKGNTDSVRVYKEPGESWMYSGGGYTIMQLMIEDNESVSFAETMQQNVLNPLGMNKSTFINPLPSQYHNLAATGYRGNGTEVEGKWPIYPEMAAAGLWTTPSQLIQYAIEVQKINRTEQDGLLKYSSVKAMLTPGMNNHGLGPQVNLHSFGHGGADEGFRANLVAWNDQDNAVVMMVNSDNGSIMQEVLLAIAKEYDLPGVDADVHTPIEISAEVLEKYTGKFKINELGDLEVKLVDGQLHVFAQFIGNTVKLMPESNTKFFDQTDGTVINFDIKSDKVVGFNVQRFRANRVD